MVLSHLGSSGNGGEIIIFLEVFPHGLPLIIISAPSSRSEVRFDAQNKTSLFPLRTMDPIFFPITRAALLGLDLYLWLYASFDFHLQSFLFLASYLIPAEGSL